MKLNNAALITADADDLSFCINTIRENPHLGTWLSIEFDGAGSTAVVRVTSAALISDTDDDYWALDCEITEIHSAPGIDVGYRVHDQCTLTTPADSHSHEAHPDGFLSLPDPPRDRDCRTKRQSAMCKSPTSSKTWLPAPLAWLFSKTPPMPADIPPDE